MLNHKATRKMCLTNQQRRKRALRLPRSIESIADLRRSWKILVRKRQNRAYSMIKMAGSSTPGRWAHRLPGWIIRRFTKHYDIIFISWESALTWYGWYSPKNGYLDYPFSTHQNTPLQMTIKIKKRGTGYWMIFAVDLDSTSVLLFTEKGLRAASAALILKLEIGWKKNARGKQKT